MILVPVRHSKISRALTVQGGIPASLHLCLLGKERHGRSSDLRSYLVITFSLLMMRQAVKAIILAKASFYLVISSDRWTQNATQRSHYAKLIVLRLFEPHFNILFGLTGADAKLHRDRKREIEWLCEGVCIDLYDKLSRRLP